MNKGVKTASGEIIYLKTNFEVDDKIEEFYTGGSVHVCNNGERLFTMCGSAVKVLSVESGRVEHILEEEEDVVTCFAVSPDSEHLVVAWRSLLLKQYDWKNDKITHSWRGHLGPVVSMTFDCSSTLVATGSSDSTIKVWDCEKHYCTHNLRGSKGIVTLVQFHPDSDASMLFSSSSVDCKIRVWSLQSSRCIKELSGHVSGVTSLGMSVSGDTLLSAGRDKVVQVWDLSGGTIKKTIPVFESIEGMILLPDTLQDKLSHRGEGVLFATAGDKGIIRVWSTSETSPLHCLEPLSSHEPQQQQQGEVREDENGQVYVGLHYCAGLEVIVGVTSDHNIIMYSASDGCTQVKQFIGYLDEVLDMRFVGNSESLLAVATNTDQVKVFDRSSCNCQLLSGHTGIVLCMDASSDGQFLVTSSKDNSIRVWSHDSQSGLFKCVAMGTGHTHAVGAVAISRLKKSFVVSGSQDCTIKMWSLKSLRTEHDRVVRLKVKYTQIAHKKDINALDVSPNDKLVVSGSQDKTANIWQVSDGSLLGSLRGHRRGVWSVKFSPVDQCVATASGDGTVKIWAISDFTCVKTFEGHANSVLKVIFLSRGMQLASCGSDGLVKVWTIRSNECVATLDQHTEKIWSLACCNDGDLLVSGGADSLVCYWKDVSKEVEARQVAEKEQLILREQELSNLIHQKNYVKAVGLAISLDQPFRVSQILQELYDEGGTDGRFTETILQLREDQIHALLKFLNKWNTNAHSSCLAQQTLSVILKSTPVEKLTQVEDIKKIVDGLVPYTERHFNRLSRLQQLSMFMEYTRQCMSLPTASSGLERDSKECVTMEVEPIVRQKEAVSSQHSDSIDAVLVDDGQVMESDSDHHDNSEDHVTPTTTMKKVSKRIQRKTKLKEKLSRKRSKH